jgi:hypothetical protein
VYIIVWYKILHDIKWQNEVTDWLFYCN